MNTILESRPRLLGTYSIPSAVQYIVATINQTTNLSLNTKHLYYWTRDGLAGGYLTGIKNRKLFVNFLDLISLRAIAIMRANGLKHHEIQVAEKVLADRYNCEYPFANIQFWTLPPKDIFVQEDGIFLSASRHMQAALDVFGETLQPMKDLDFDIFGLSSSWKPRQNILFNPQVQYGEPCIEGTRVSTQVLWSFHQAGDSVDTLSRFYGIQPKRIQDAIDWENQIQEAIKARN